jgi:ribosomal protein S18 acetylase RimI-like enzyme
METKETQPYIEQKLSEVRVKKYQPNSWVDIREQIMGIEEAAFEHTGYGEGMMRSLFEDERNLNYLLKNFDGKIIGYTQALIKRDSAHIVNTAIAPEHQGKRLCC